jgi:hypothetical protein
MKEQTEARNRGSKGRGGLRGWGGQWRRAARIMEDEGEQVQELERRWNEYQAF